MYNLRFYIDDDNKIIKCDCNRITQKNEIDIALFDEIILSKKELNEIFMILSRHDLNHDKRSRNNYTIHEFVVPGNVIRDLKSRMYKYKEQLATRREERKFNNQNKEIKKRKIKRTNKFIKRKIITSLVTLLTLSTITFGATKLGSNNKNYNLNEDKVIETTIDNDFSNDVYGVESIINTNLPNDIEEKNEIDNSVNIQNVNAFIPENENKEIYEDNYEYIVKLNAENLTDTKKYIDCYNNYYPIIEKYANMYGIDPKLAVAIACQERGVHSNEIDAGGAIGLFQIQVNVWDNETVKAYNFETQTWEEYEVHLDNIRNLEDNIKVGMMYLQECLIRDDYNIAMSVQEYNFGHGGVMRAINEASNTLGTSIEELETKGNNEWLDYRYAFKSKSGNQMGDPNYVENVFRYLNDEDILKFKTPDNKEINVKYDNLAFESKMTF